MRTFIRQSVCLWLLALTVLSGPAFGAGKFPLRDKYPQVKCLTTEELAENYGTTCIIDVRSKLEFDVLHVNNARHIPVAQRDFLTELEKVRSRAGAVPIAFYCNGYTCAKSYKAATRAMEAGFKNVYAYDAGIYEWVTTHPAESTLMGLTPASPAKLISDETFKSRKIGYSEFAAKAGESHTVIIDIREPFQRSKNTDLSQNKLLTLTDVRNIPSDRLIALLKKGEFKQEQLLIFDAVGKQVRWLQYDLEENGYDKYYFLDKGVLSAAEVGAVR